MIMRDAHKKEKQLLVFEGMEEREEVEKKLAASELMRSVVEEQLKEALEEIDRLKKEKADEKKKGRESVGKVKPTEEPKAPRKSLNGGGEKAKKEAAAMLASLSAEMASMDHAFGGVDRKGGG